LSKPGPAQEIFAHPQDPYTQELLAHSLRYLTV